MSGPERYTDTQAVLSGVLLLGSMALVALLIYKWPDPGAALWIGFVLGLGWGYAHGWDHARASR